MHGFTSGRSTALFAYGLFTFPNIRLETEVSDKAYYYQSLNRGRDLIPATLLANQATPIVRPRRPQKRRAWFFLSGQRFNRAVPGGGLIDRSDEKR